MTNMLRKVFVIYQYLGGVICVSLVYVAKAVYMYVVINDHKCVLLCISQRLILRDVIIQLTQYLTSLGLSL